MLLKSGFTPWVSLVFLVALVSLPAWPQSQAQPEVTLDGLLAHPQDSGPYYYNLGTLYLRDTDQTPLAVAYLTRAARLHPDDPDVEKQLEIAQNRLRSSHPGADWDPASDLIEKGVSEFSWREWGACVGLLFLLGSGLGLREYLRSRKNKSPLDSSLGVTVAALYGAALLLCALYLWGNRHPVGFVLRESVIRSGPGATFNEIKTLQTGVQVRRTTEKQLDAEGKTEWVQIRYSPQGLAWIKFSDLLLL